MSFMDKQKNKIETNTYNDNYNDNNSTSARSSYQLQVQGTYGWVCPLCGRGVSPMTSYCPCRGWYPLKWSTDPIYCKTNYSSGGNITGNTKTINIK